MVLPNRVFDYKIGISIKIGEDAGVQASLMKKESIHFNNILVDNK